MRFPPAGIPSSLGVLIPGMTTALGAVNYTGVGGSGNRRCGRRHEHHSRLHGGRAPTDRQNLNGLSTGWANEAFETLWIVNMAPSRKSSSMPRRCPPRRPKAACG